MASKVDKELYGKNKLFSQGVKSYNHSIIAIFNILGVLPSDSVFEAKKIYFDKVEYPLRISLDVYKKYKTRHAFVDLMELTREILLSTVCDIFSHEFNIKDKKNSIISLKKMKVHALSVKNILQILKIENEFQDFITFYSSYQKARNCLNHRFGLIKNEDGHITFIVYRKNYTIKLNEKFYDFETVNEIIAFSNQHKASERFIGIKLTRQEKSYSIGDKIILDDGDIFGVAWFLHQSIRSVLIKIFSSLHYKIDVESYFDAHTPFRNRLEINYSM